MEPWALRKSFGNRIQVGDEVEWQGCRRKVVAVVSVVVALDGAEDAICLPVSATRVEIFKD